MDAADAASMRILDMLMRHELAAPDETDVASAG
jgi:hypothetical protein